MGTVNLELCDLDTPLLCSRLFSFKVKLLGYDCCQGYDNSSNDGYHDLNKLGQELLVALFNAGQLTPVQVCHLCDALALVENCGNHFCLGKGRKRMFHPVLRSCHTPTPSDKIKSTSNWIENNRESGFYDQSSF